MLLARGWLVECIPIPSRCAAHHLTTWLESGPTSTPNVGGIVFVSSLHIRKRTWDYDNDPTWENAHIVENHQIPIIFFHVPYLLVAFLSTLATFYLLLPSRLFCKVCIRDFLHVILIFLHFFHLCFFIFLLPLKVCMCDIEFYHHITFLLVI